ncbi:MAG TPA: MFS transporter [Vicinamibacterales bacterium]|jgi:AAHS family 4-hydroxybenzoate transporter-like MFS transporter
MKTVDVGAVLDEGRWTGYQKLLIVGTALAIILDGIDNQLLPNAVPFIAPEWGLQNSAFRNALATGPFGMMIGGLAGGILGDRYGRRTALLGSVISFGVLTIAIASVNSVFLLGLLRFIAGVGLGGAMPNAASLASEYVPRRQRPFAVTLTIVCIPLGGFVASTMAGIITPAYGWRALFVIGGLVPVAVAIVLWKALPESPRYLAGRRERWPELTHVMRRMGRDVPPDVAYVEAAAGAQTSASKATIADLFAPVFRRDTIGLFGSFFFCLMVNYVAIQLVPSILRDAGKFTPAAATGGLQWVNIGGVIGAVVGALVIQRVGSRLTMLGMCVAAVICSLIMSGMKLDPTDTFALMAMFLITGGLLNAVQTTMYALAAHVYPTEIRSTGVGAAVAFGRIGNVLAVYVGGFAFDRGGPAGYFQSWAILMAIVFVSLAVIGRHVPKSAALTPAPAGAAPQH